MFLDEDDEGPEDIGLFARFFDEQADRVERRICDHNPLSPREARRRCTCKTMRMR